MAGSHPKVAGSYPKVAGSPPKVAGSHPKVAGRSCKLSIDCRSNRLLKKCLVTGQIATLFYVLSNMPITFHYLDGFGVALFQNVTFIVNTCSMR